MKRSNLVSALSALFLASCGSPEPDDTPVIGSIQSGDYTVVLHSAPDGPRYTIEDAGGKVLAEQIDAPRFAAEFPRIYDEVKGLWAGNDSAVSREAAIDSSPVAPRPYRESAGAESNFGTEPGLELPPIPDLRAR